MILTPDLSDWIRSTLGASSIESAQIVQSLWSGYGQIVRVQLRGCRHSSVIVKEISPPDQSSEHEHPRGWNTSLSHRRKLRSYEVEQAFYATFADRCDEHCRVARCLATASDASKQVLILEDLDASGFPIRHRWLNPHQVKQGLAWLASFHAVFLHEADQATSSIAKGLWPVGTYWHLDTRPDELDAMPHGDLKRAASEIDERLRNARYQTLVHGDAKVANMCFRHEPNLAPAMVDFQYVGRGCGMKDVAYFFSSCISEDECERHEDEYLDAYFQSLRQAMTRREGSSVHLTSLEAEWRRLYPIAWADFVRFLEGWCPGHAKLTGHTQKMVQLALQKL
ncbi:ecdysteroid 22-kinase family protein [Rhodopirellula sp. JC740]|uniref:Ecdysteroid 22-kinase family protein n=1 Tax=Rhodopirellula halodulae TaxID=2894198 RepID=A0ABS8NCQ8_9BACT|nr:ecdysteroid 22-kinase family protein [Rhodopirellula sp. JC740]MCC9641333.1 ecdysteroid 22-kinase family protein [Rhodopirellula sp. JC740]